MLKKYHEIIYILLNNLKNKTFSSLQQTSSSCWSTFDRFDFEMLQYIKI